MINAAGLKRTRVSSVSCPRIAAVGCTRLASSAGTAAAISDSGSPMAIAIQRWPRFMSGGAATAAMYNVLTVRDVIVTAASASRRARPRPSAMPSHRQRGGLAEEEQQDLVAAQSERAQRADLLAARDHRDGDGVVDQEQSDDQRDPRQRREVGVERREHGLDLLAAPCRPLCRHARRQPCRDRREALIQVGAFGKQHVEVIDAAEAIERQLRRGNVHQHEIAVEHARRSFVLQDAAYHERQHADRRSSGAAHCRACSCGASPASR